MNDFKIAIEGAAAPEAAIALFETDGLTGEYERDPEATCDVEGAIALYQQSLEMAEQIGDVQGKAATLAMLGQLLADEKGDSATAIVYLQESLDILQRIGSPDARTVQDILNRITSESSN